MQHSRSHFLKILASVSLALSSQLMAQSPDRRPVFEPSIPAQQGSNAENLFLNAKVTASGTFENFTPEQAVDGIVDGSKYWCSENLPVWLQIDMGKEQQLGSIHFWPYWEDGRVYKYTIEYSLDGRSWKTIVNQSANSITGTAEGSLFTFTPVKARYVKVNILDNSRGKRNGGHIVEIKGYAKNEQAELNAAAFSTNERLAPSGAPDASKAAKKIEQTAWRGERVVAQAGLWSGKGIEDIFMDECSIKNDKGATIPVKASFVRYTKARGQIYADIIDPVKRVDLPPGTTRTVWLSIDVPQSAAPGLYKGIFKVKGKDTKVCSIPVEINVLPNVLPVPSKWKCHVDLWQHPESVARVHNVESWSDEHFALMKPVMKMLADAGQKTITCSLIDEAWNGQTYDKWPSMIEWIKKTDGTMAYDYTKFDKWVTFMLKDVGLDGMITCYTMIPWSLKLKYYDQKRGTYDFMPINPGDASFEAVWGPFLKDFSAHAKAKGWLDRICIGIDERPDHMVNAAKDVLKKNAPDFKIVSAVDKPSKTTETVYDFSVTFHHADSVSKEEMDKRRKEGRKTTFYVCVNPPKPNTFTNSLLAESEWLGYFGAAMRFDGMLRWAYNSWNRDPFETTDFGNWPPGDCFLVYPGGRSSLRFEKLREGFEEFEKIRILRELAAQPRATAKFKQAVADMEQTLTELFTIKKGGASDQANDVEQARAAVEKASKLATEAQK